MEERNIVAAILAAGVCASYARATQEAGGGVNAAFAVTQYRHALQLLAQHDATGPRGSGGPVGAPS